MLQWIGANIGTIIISLVLLAVVVLIIRNLAGNRKQGKSSCSCDCSNCASCGACHSHK